MGVKKFLWGSSNERSCLEDLGIAGWMIVKWISEQ
jgi:hypothetical protein